MLSSYLRSKFPTDLMEWRALAKKGRSSTRAGREQHHVSGCWTRQRARQWRPRRENWSCLQTLKKINKCEIVFGPTYEDSQQVAKSSPERFLYIIFIMCHPSKGPIGSVRSEVKFDLLSIFNQKHFCHLSRVLGCKCDCFGIRSSLPGVELSLSKNCYDPSYEHLTRWFKA